VLRFISFHFAIAYILHRECAPVGGLLSSPSCVTNISSSVYRLKVKSALSHSGVTRALLYCSYLCPSLPFLSYARFYLSSRRLIIEHHWSILQSHTCGRVASSASCWGGPEIRSGYLGSNISRLSVLSEHDIKHSARFDPRRYLFITSWLSDHSILNVVSIWKRHLISQGWNGKPFYVAQTPLCAPKFSWFILH
jgi:hypothetical protein